MSTLQEKRVVEAFVMHAATAMRDRLVDGLRRGWGTSWQSDYPDADVKDRLAKATADLLIALDYRRGGYPIEDELRKRAADVANQAFMLADPQRIATPEGG